MKTAWILLAVVLWPFVGRADDPTSPPKTEIPKVTAPDTPSLPSFEHSTVLPTMIVSDSRQMKDQLNELKQGPLKPEPKPTLVDGGVLARTGEGKTTIEFGAERWNDIFYKDAKFTEKKAMVKIELLNFRR